MLNYTTYTLSSLEDESTITAQKWQKLKVHHNDCINTCPEVRSFSLKIFMTHREAVDNVHMALERAQKAYLNIDFQSEFIPWVWHLNLCAVSPREARGLCENEKYQHM